MDNLIFLLPGVTSMVAAFVLRKNKKFLHINVVLSIFACTYYCSLLIQDINLLADVACNAKNIELKAFSSLAEAISGLKVRIFYLIAATISPCISTVITIAFMIHNNLKE